MAIPDPFDMYEMAVVHELRLVKDKLMEAANSGKFAVKFHLLQPETVEMLEERGYEVDQTGASVLVSFSSRPISEIVSASSPPQLTFVNMNPK